MISALQSDPGKATTMTSLVIHTSTTETLTCLCYDVGLALYISLTLGFLVVLAYHCLSLVGRINLKRVY